MTTATATLVTIHVAASKVLVTPRSWEWELIALYLASSALNGCGRKQQQRMLRYLLDRFQATRRPLGRPLGSRRRREERGTDGARIAPVLR